MISLSPYGTDFLDVKRLNTFLGITLDPLYILCVLTLIKPGPSGTNFSYVILSLKSKFESQIYGVFFWQGVEDWVKWFKF